MTRMSEEQCSRLADALAQVVRDPKSWNQGAWAKRSDCGTQFCLAGWVVVQSGQELIWELGEGTRAAYTEDFRWIGEEARYLLGISEDDADALFFGANGLEDLLDYADEFSDGRVDAERVAKRAAEMDAEEIPPVEEPVEQPA